jgi:NFACT protein RNA binding domain
MFFITLIEPDYLCYMGKHKEENEELIRWGWPEDIWFHVDKLSSAHVYLRLRPGETVKDIPPKVLEDCVQLVKQNSIEGCKQAAVDVVYTPWENLKKTGDMQAGQVGFHSDKAVVKVHAVKRDRATILRLKKNVREVCVVLSVCRPLVRFRAVFSQSCSAPLPGLSVFPDSSHPTSLLTLVLIKGVAHTQPAGGPRAARPGSGSQCAGAGSGTARRGAEGRRRARAGRL